MLLHGELKDHFVAAVSEHGSVKEMTPHRGD